MSNFSQHVYDLHRELLATYPGTHTVADVISKQAIRLFEAHQTRDPRTTIQLSNWLPQCIGKSDRDILAMTLSLEDMQHSIAREHGFTTAEAALANKTPLHREFEQALTAMMQGDINRLDALLGSDPGLIDMQSPYGHQATLLNYMAANGVETWRQKTPANAPDMLNLLLEKGANPTARVHVYGGQYDTLALLMTSSHPADAGVQEEMAAILKAALKNWKT